MRKFLIIVTSFCFIFLLFACVKDSYDWEECHPRIFIRFDWSTVVKPGENEKVNVVVAGEQRDTSFLQIGPDGQEVRLTPQLYDFIGYTSVDNVTVSGRTVTVNRDANGNYVEPHDFSGGAVSQEIIQTDQDQTVTIPMRQQTRPLIIRVILRGQALGGFSHITGEISGIAMSRDINNGFVPLDNEPLHNAYITGDVSYDLTRQIEATNRIVYSDMKTLLGLDGSAGQTLQLTAYYTSGNSNTIEVNVTSKMLGFHTENVDEPWVLEFTLDLVGELQTDIQDWTGNYLSLLPAYRD